MSWRQSPLVFNRNNPRACRFNRPLQKAENLTPAERVKYGKPLRAKPGTRRLSIFAPRRPFAPADSYVHIAIARNRGLH